MTQPISVLVTGVGGGTIGEQVCKALRMGKKRYEIISTNVSKESLSIFKAEYYEVIPHASDDNYLDVIISLINKYNIQFLIPGSELELIKLSKFQNSFSHLETKMLINSNHVIMTCVDKRRTFDYLEERGFRVPVTFEVRRTEELDDVRTNYPYIIKPAEKAGGSSGTVIAQDKKELIFFVNYLLEYGNRVIVQEYIGKAGDEFTIGVLHNPDGKLIGTVVLNRHILSGLSNRICIPNQTGRSELGKVLAISSGISQGRVVNLPSVRIQAENIAKTLKSVGPLNIQGRLNGDEFVPFEINPRFSGTTPMRAMAGLNEPELLINYYLCHGQPQIKPRIRYGHFMRGLVECYIPNTDDQSEAPRLKSRGI